MRRFGEELELLIVWLTCQANALQSGQMSGERKEGTFVPGPRAQALPQMSVTGVKWEARDLSTHDVLGPQMSLHGAASGASPCVIDSEVRRPESTTAILSSELLHSTGQGKALNECVCVLRFQWDLNGLSEHQWNVTTCCWHPETLERGTDWSVTHS